MRLTPYRSMDEALPSCRCRAMRIQAVQGSPHRRQWRCPGGRTSDALRNYLHAHRAYDAVGSSLVPALRSWPDMKRHISGYSVQMTRGWDIRASTRDAQRCASVRSQRLWPVMSWQQFSHQRGSILAKDHLGVQVGWVDLPDELAAASARR